ncbi:MAG: MarR family transcriptional regulator [Anaerobutyricum sp.]
MILDLMQGWIMGYLYDHKGGEIFQRDIEAQFYIARSTITYLVKQMEQKGYIARVAVERDCRLKRLSFGKRRKRFINVFFKILKR